MDAAAAREGYRAALQMVSHESKVAWDSFRALLAANTVLVGLIGAILKLYPNFSALKLALEIAGLVICIAWALITARSFDYYKYWFAWARKYEKDALASEKNMIQCGKSFSEGESVNEVTPTQRLRWASRLFRIEWLAYVVILGFVVIYAFLLSCAA